MVRANPYASAAAAARLQAKLKRLGREPSSSLAQLETEPGTTPMFGARKASPMKGVATSVQNEATVQTAQGMQAVRLNVPHPQHFAAAAATGTATHPPSTIETEPGSMTLALRMLSTATPSRSGGVTTSWARVLEQAPASIASAPRLSSSPTVRTGSLHTSPAKTVDPQTRSDSILTRHRTTWLQSSRRLRLLPPARPPRPRPTPAFRRVYTRLPQPDDVIVTGTYVDYNNGEKSAFFATSPPSSVSVVVEEINQWQKTLIWSAAGQFDSYAYAGSSPAIDLRYTLESRVYCGVRLDWINPDTGEPQHYVLEGPATNGSGGTPHWETVATYTYDNDPRPISKSTYQFSEYRLVIDQCDGTTWTNGVYTSTWYRERPAVQEYSQKGKWSATATDGQKTTVHYFETEPSSEKAGFTQQVPRNQFEFSDPGPNNGPASVQHTSPYLSGFLVPSLSSDGPAPGGGEEDGAELWRLGIDRHFEAPDWQPGAGDILPPGWAPAPNTNPYSLSNLPTANRPPRPPVELEPGTTSEPRVLETRSYDYPPHELYPTTFGFPDVPGLPDRIAISPGGSWEIDWGLTPPPSAFNPGIDDLLDRTRRYPGIPTLSVSPGGSSEIDYGSITSPLAVAAIGSTAAPQISTGLAATLAKIGVTGLITPELVTSILGAAALGGAALLIQNTNRQGTFNADLTQGLAPLGNPFILGGGSNPFITRDPELEATLGGGTGLLPPDFVEQPHLGQQLPPITGDRALDDLLRNGLFDFPDYNPEEDCDLQCRKRDAAYERAIEDALRELLSKPFFEIGRGNLTGNLNDIKPHERDRVEELLRAGNDIEIIPRRKIKTPDLKVNDVFTELKKLNKAGKNTLKNAIQDAAEQSKEQIEVDARDVPISAEQAKAEILRAQGNIIKSGKPSLEGRVTVLTAEGPVNF